jgi:hypothetical protein
VGDDEKLMGVLSVEYAISKDRKTIGNRFVAIDVKTSRFRVEPHDQGQCSCTHALSLSVRWDISKV